MLSKLYFAVLGLSVAVMAFFTYYSWSWLQSIGLPAGAVDGYVYHADLSWIALWITTAALLVTGTAVLWAGGRAWAIWVAFLYFAVFVIARFFWLDQAFVQFKKANGLADGGISVAPLFAVMLIISMGVVVFLDHFAIVRLRRKMYPSVAADEAKVETESPTE